MRTRASTLVGRQRERRVLADAVARATDQQGSVVVVRGAAGIGKSRLVSEAVGDAAGAGMPVLRGRASATGIVTPLRPFGEALAALQRRGRLPGPEVLDAYYPVLARVLPDLAGPDASRLPESSIAFSEAMLRVLLHAGGDTGCVLVLEDLHGADDESLAVVEYLADNVSDVPVAVFVTMREARTPATELAESLQLRGSVEILDLSPLDRDAMPDLAAACLGAAGKQLPADLLALLWSGSAGGPLQVEEMLYELVETGHLVPSESAWRLVAEHPAGAPTGVGRSVALRIRSLGPSAGRMLACAALLGEQFPMELVQRSCGLPERDFYEQLQAAVRAQLLTTADRPDWYAFEHPLIAEAAVTALGAAERRELRLTVAKAVVAARPLLPGGWRLLAADLFEAAGRPVTAATLLVAAGRAALDGGGPTVALPMLERAVEWLSDRRVDDDEDVTPGGRDTVPALRTTARGLLVQALIDVGTLDRARLQVDGAAAGADMAEVTDMHLALAWAFHLAGRGTDAREQLSIATLMTSAELDPARQAHIDAISANLPLDDERLVDLAGAEQFGRAAAARAEAAGVPEAACRAWHAVGRVARPSDLAESSRCFERLVSIARDSGLRGWVVLGLVGLAGNAWLSDGDFVALEAARRQARTDGAVQISLAVSANLALDEVLRGEVDDPSGHLAEVYAESVRLGNRGLAAYSTMADVVRHAHAGRTEDMRLASSRLADHASDRDAIRDLAVGLGEVFAALIESDDDAAASTLDRLALAAPERPTMFHLTGPSGLHLLLTALGGRISADEVSAELSSTRGSMRWNRQFGELALATAAGRAGDLTTAQAAASRWAQASECYPLARHLGARLVAETAVSAGWGDLVPRLREAEEWFHHAGLATASRACRAILRRLGEQVGQRRDGADALPAQARRAGITVREFEVYLLVLEKHGNKAIAERLHISPRTVEKHLASLIGKLGVDNREALLRAESLAT